MDSGIEANGAIEELCRRTRCKKDFQCYKFGFKSPVELRNIGTADFVECLSKNAPGCEHSFSFGDSYFCKCPVWLHVAKILKK